MLSFYRAFGFEPEGEARSAQGHSVRPFPLHELEVDAHALGFTDTANGQTSEHEMRLSERV